MTLEELDKLLNEYTVDELFYRDYHNAKLKTESLKAFIENLDVEFVKSRKVIIPHSPDGFKPFFMKEEDCFESKRQANIIISKHYRYTPVFVHSHTFLEMIYVYSGNCKQEICGTEIHLTMGDVCVIPPETNHTIHVFDDSIIINILIRKSTFNDTFLKVLSDENVLSFFFTRILYTKNYNNYIIFRTGDDTKVRDILSNIYIEYIENKKYSNKVLDNLLMIFFAYILREHEDQVELPKELQKSSQNISSILAYIQGNFKTVSLDELSDKFHFTVPYMSKIIKDNTGYNFKEIIQTIKLKKAEELLSKTSLKICNISDTVGYENNTHFIRTFKKVYGKSPNQYRKGSFM